MYTIYEDFSEFKSSERRPSPSRPPTGFRVRMTEATCRPSHRDSQVLRADATNGPVVVDLVDRVLFVPMVLVLEMDVVAVMDVVIKIRKFIFCVGRNYERLDHN